VACGDTITADTTLDSDLIDCPNNGIVIGADDITLDLDGHTVEGNNELLDPCHKDQFCDTGILDHGHSGVTIGDGAVTHFGTGTFILGVSHNRVHALEASHNTFNGVLIVESRRSALTGSSTSFNGLETDFPGIAVFGSRHIQIRRTTSTRNADLGVVRPRVGPEPLRQ